MTTSRLIFATALYAASICASPGEDLKAISEVTAKWDSALNEGKPEALLELVTEDFERAVQGQTPTKGQKAFLEAASPYFKKFRFENSKHVAEEVNLADNWALVRGSYSTNVVPLSGEKPYATSAKWTLVFERQKDGTFKVSRGYGYDVKVAPALE